MALIHLSSDKLPDDTSVRRFQATEQLSAPYRVEIELATEQADFDIAGMIRERALVTLVGAHGEQRHLDGLIEEARFAGHTGTLFHFRLVVVPLLATLAYREDCRIFQELSAVDVVKQVLADAGVDEQVDWRLQQEVGSREFIVQYRETDLNFVQRLMEDEGIFFFFEHTQEGHRLVFGDHPDAFAAQPDLTPVCFGMVQGLTEATDPLETMSYEERVRPTEMVIRDFDHTTPQVKPESVATAAGPFSLRQVEYPGGLRTADGQAQRRVEARLKALRADSVVVRGQSQAVGLCPGIPFAVAGAAEECCNGEFVATKLETTGEQGPAEETGNLACANQFEAIPAGKDFAPPRVARRPRIRGVQTGIVTGPSNEQQAIHCDEQGRIKVRFHWDRAGIGDDKSSCWLRVGQIGIGGSMIIPRVGWEVTVAFLDGDPDRPLVTGRLYNGKQRPLTTLPAGAACGSLTSLATPGAAGQNSFGTDDSGGSQGFSMGGQKDINTFVGADKSETVGVDENHSVVSNLSSTVGATESWLIGGDQAINVGNALQTTTNASQTLSVGGSETLGAKANYIEALGARTYSVSGNRITISNGVRNLVSGAFTRSVGAVQVNITPCAINDGLTTYSETVGAVKAELILGDSAENVGGKKALTSSAAELHMVANYNTKAATVSRTIGGVHFTKCGGNYEVSAPEIALAGGVGHFKGGGSSLKLNGGPIVVKGAKIAIKSALIRKKAASLKLG